MEKEGIVTKANIFETVIKAHYQNFLSSLPHFKEGQMYDNVGAPLTEGEGENPHYKGVYLLYDGERILQTASERVTRGSAIRETNPILDTKDFLGYLTGTKAGSKDPDIVLAYDTVGAKMTRIKGELKNDFSGDLDDLLNNCLPDNFVSYDKKYDVNNVGTKTANAVLTAYALNEVQDRGIRAIVVKRTPYSNAGMGKVAEFGKEGLTREFFFRYDSDHQGPFIDLEHSIVGEYREWKKVNGEFVVAKESYVSITPEGKVQYTPKIAACRMAA